MLDNPKYSKQIEEKLSALLPFRDISTIYEERLDAMLLQRQCSWFQESLNHYGIRYDEMLKKQPLKSPSNMRFMHFLFSIHM